MAACSVLTLSLRGCFKVGPDFAKPSASVDRAWSPAPCLATRDAVADAGWWRGFGDPQLDDLTDRASRENLPLQRAGVRVLQARAMLAATVGAHYPQQQQAFAALEKESARPRFRPIVMTSLAFGLGVAPLVAASGAGASARASIGLAVLSGMLANTLLAVLFVPPFFTVLQGIEERLRQHGTKAASEAAPP
jgi:outer membrane protein TolC